MPDFKNKQHMSCILIHDLGHNQFRKKTQLAGFYSLEFLLPINAIILPNKTASINPVANLKKETDIGTINSFNNNDMKYMKCRIF